MMILLSRSICFETWWYLVVSAVAFFGGGAASREDGPLWPFQSVKVTVTYLPESLH